jgi:thioredoxin reductase
MQDHDVIVVGGSFAGLATALALVRARFKVLVIDAGSPRNRFASASHGFLGSDGENPAAILVRSRTQIAAYREATFVEGEAVSARGGPGAFTVELADGSTVRGGMLVLATGVSDVLPAIPGLEALWGESVIHCPFCHGYEFDGGPLGVLATGPVSLGQAKVIPRWGPTTFFLNGMVELSDDDRRDFATRGVTIEETPVQAAEADGQALSGLLLADGRSVPLVGLYLVPEMRMTSGLAEGLGCAFVDTPLGRIVETGADKRTSVPGVFAVGDMARVPHSVTFAVADGAFAAMSIVHDSVMA